MKTFLQIVAAFYCLFSHSLAFANIPSSALSNVTMTVYGVYTTTDPTCQTGLIATLPLSKTATSINLVGNPTLGHGNVASTINCVVMVIANSIGPVTWSAGTYTGTSTSGGGTFSDNIAACNNGGTQAAGSICRSSTISWPDQVKTDAAAAGLTISTSCTGSASEVLPVYLSIDSGCSTSLDTGCSSWSSFSPPTAAGDLSHGCKLTVPSAGSIYRFIVDFSSAMGATGSSTCGMYLAPKFSFKTIQ